MLSGGRTRPPPGGGFRLRLYDTRAQAMGGMVDEWDRWRRRYQARESALIVHGPNSDVDLLNELAQRKRLDAGELGEQTIRAVDRDHLLRPGDVVAIRNAAYTFPAPLDGPRPKRIENGQTAIVESVDPKRDALTLLLREPGAEPRVVEIDQTQLRKDHAAGKRTAAIRLNYALHSFPAQGATVRGTATLAGHWSQAKQETYVGDTRAIYRHSLHVAREDLGTDGTDEDRIGRYAQRISHSRQRQASIRSALDAHVQLGVSLPDQQLLPCRGTSSEESTPVKTPPGPASKGRSVPEASAPSHAGWRDRAGAEEADNCVGSDPPEHPIRALGERPDDRTARERWEREARRLEALRFRGRIATQPAWPPAARSTPAAALPAPALPAPASPRHGGPMIKR